MTFRPQKQTNLNAVFGHTRRESSLVLIFHLVNFLYNWPRRRVTRVVFKNSVITSRNLAILFFQWVFSYSKMLTFCFSRSSAAVLFLTFCFSVQDEMRRQWSLDDRCKSSHSTLLTRGASDRFSNAISSPLIWQHLWSWCGCPRSQFIDSHLRAYHRWQSQLLVILNNFWQERQEFWDKNVRYPLHSRRWCGCP